MSTNESAAAGRSPRFWMILFILAFCAVIALKLTEAVNGVTAFLLLAASMGLLIPVVRAGERRGCASPALRRYNRRVLLASFAYVLGLGIAVSLWRHYELARPVVFSISLLPALPTFGMVWSMARYLVEEQDEYLRHRMIMASLVALGVVLAAGIFWGFLEMFELVPHLWAWWVLPVWAVSHGVADLVMKARNA